MNCKIVTHQLASGATTISLHPQEFTFSDGTQCPEQSKELLDHFVLDYTTQLVGTVAGMDIVKRRPILTHTQLEHLADLSNQADVIICPTGLLEALEYQGWRDHYKNCVSIGPTKETRGKRDIPLVVDVNNWRH